MTRDDSYLYTIRPDQGYFHSGITGDGRQVLMGLYCPDLIALFFDTAGDYLGHEERRLEFLQRNYVIVDGVPIEALSPTTTFMINGSILDSGHRKMSWGSET